MSFWSQLNSDSRRFRPTTTTTGSTTRNGSNLFRDPSPETDMFFDTSHLNHPNMTFPRSNLAERWGSSVFDDFPRSRMRTSFSTDPSNSFGSLHRQRNPQRWMSGDRSSEGCAGVGGGSESREGSPASSKSEGSNSRKQSFHGAIPIRVAHSSRSSTPDSTGSGSASGKSEQNTAPPNSNETATVSPSEGVEEHPMANSKPGQQSFTAKRTPKVHHIPIHVEPRDGPHPVTMTPPIARDTPNVEMAGPSFPIRTEEVPVEVPSAPSPVERIIPVKVIPNEQKASRNNQSKVETKAEEVRRTTPPPKSDHPPKRKTQIEIVQDVCDDVERLRLIVAKFEGTKGGKDYMFLDEMLTRNLIRLDNIETEGNESLRQARKAAVAAIHECICYLDQRAQLTDAVKMDGETQDSEEVVTQPEFETIECETTDEQPKSETNETDVKKEPNAVEEVQMEVENAVGEEEKPMEETEPVESGDGDRLQLPSAADDDDETTENQQKTAISTNETVSS